VITIDHLQKSVDTIAHREVAHVYGADTLRRASELMASSEIGALLVRRGTHAVGIVTERDVVMAVGEGADVDEVRVADVMSEDLAGVMQDATVFTAVDSMARHGVRHLVVRDDGRIVGIVSARDVLDALRSA
jgi:predicted transcriptional regulator